jgi:hypothetical protein
MPIAVHLVWSEQDHRPQLVMSPSTLLGAMVCQFAAAVHGAWPFQKCAYCYKFFRLAPGVNQANRRTCSPTCKQYLYNRRAKQARQLRAEGWTVHEIVQELQVKPHRGKSSVEIVNSWIARK